MAAVTGKYRRDDNKMCIPYVCSEVNCKIKRMNPKYTDRHIYLLHLYLHKFVYLNDEMELILMKLSDLLCFFLQINNISEWEMKKKHNYKVKSNGQNEKQRFDSSRTYGSKKKTPFNSTGHVYMCIFSSMHREVSIIYPSILYLSIL